jgi:hypothetical protein
MGFTRALIVSVGPMAPLILANERDRIARRLRSCLLPILANPIIVVRSGRRAECNRLERAADHREWHNAFITPCDPLHIGIAENAFDARRSKWSNPRALWAFPPCD